MVAATQRGLLPVWEARGLSALPPVTRLLLLVLVLTYALSWWPWFLNHFGLSAWRTLSQLHLWNVLTYGFIESRLWELAASVLALVTVGRLVELVWAEPNALTRSSFHASGGGLREESFQLAFYLMAVIAASGVALLLYRLVAYYLLALDAEYLFQPVTGFAAGVAALLMALARAVPHHTFQAWAPLRLLPMRYLPNIYVNAVLTPVALLPGLLNTACLAVFGTAFSWVYLRYLPYIAPGAALDTSASDDAPLGILFPDSTRRLVQRLWQRARFGSTSASPSDYTLPVTNRSSDPAEAERRRARAMRSLEERLERGAGKSDANDAQV